MENRDYKLKVILSTDGKHSVVIGVDDLNTAQVNQAYAVAKTIYGKIMDDMKGQTKIDMTSSTKEEVKDEDYGFCDKCGAPNKKSQKGKIYCSNKCWLKE